MLGAGGKFWVPVGGHGVLFTGSFRRALDDKHRLPIPRPLRDAGSEGRRFYITPGLDACLAIYPEPAFATVAERLASASPAAREIRDYSRIFFSQAACVSLDGQWRFRVPEPLLKWAGLSGEVAIVGVRDHFEIWSPAKWDAYVSRCDAQYDQLAELAFVAPRAIRATDPTTTMEDPTTSALPPQPR